MPFQIKQSQAFLCIMRCGSQTVDTNVPALGQQSDLVKEESWRTSTSQFQTLFKNPQKSRACGIGIRADVDNWNRIESPETNLNIYVQLILKIGAKTFKSGKDRFFSRNSAETMRYTQKRRRREDKRGGGERRRRGRGGGGRVGRRKKEEGKWGEKT